MYLLHLHLSDQIGFWSGRSQIRYSFPSRQLRRYNCTARAALLEFSWAWFYQRCPYQLQFLRQTKLDTPNEWSPRRRPLQLCLLGNVMENPLTLLAYPANRSETEIIITWRGESHKGLQPELLGRAMWYSTQLPFSSCVLNQYSKEALQGTVYCTMDNHRPFIRTICFLVLQTLIKTGPTESN